MDFTRLAFAMIMQFASEFRWLLSLLESIFMVNS